MVIAPKYSGSASGMMNFGFGLVKLDKFSVLHARRAGGQS
jgi:hypothetical protein